MMWSQLTVDEWRSHSGCGGWCGHSSQWMNGGVVWMMWSQFTVDEWRSCVDDVVTAHSG